eukprot:343336_1
MGYDVEEDEDLKISVSINRLPMKQWKWKHIVHWIEQIDHLRHFATIFWEWRINGDELLAMTEKQIKLLIQSCNNYHYDFFDRDDIKYLQIE